MHLRYFILYLFFTLKVLRRCFHYQPHSVGGEILHEWAMLEQLEVNGSPLTTCEWGVVNYRQSKQKFSYISQ